MPPFTRSSETRDTLESLFEQLNEMAFIFPGTELTLHYQLVGQPSPGNPKESVTTNSQE